MRAPALGLESGKPQNAGMWACPHHREQLERCSSHGDRTIKELLEAFPWSHPRVLISSLKGHRITEQKFFLAIASAKVEVPDVSSSANKSHPLLVKDHVG